ncbi:hypothetical protein Glove_186g150 [Diversispora epigaea]|uniref:Uncharacterized protein n=1 Tax=Diversispora epigaea TaxID=1348612 RepID=A0A397IME4_9GLOM|nr:hypothetical protein Glove_186g150 [Diversispora epigaea]
MWNLVRTLLQEFERINESLLNNNIWKNIYKEQMTVEGVIRLKNCFPDGVIRMRAIYYEDVLKTRPVQPGRNSSTQILSVQNEEQGAHITRKRKRIANSEEEKLLEPLILSHNEPTNREFKEILDTLSEEWDLSRVKQHVKYRRKKILENIQKDIEKKLLEPLILSHNEPTNREFKEILDTLSEEWDLSRVKQHVKYRRKKILENIQKDIETFLVIRSFFQQYYENHNSSEITPSSLYHFIVKTFTTIYNKQNRKFLRETLEIGIDENLLKQTWQKEFYREQFLDVMDIFAHKTNKGDKVYEVNKVNKAYKTDKGNEYHNEIINIDEEDPKRWIKSERNKEKKRNTEVKTLRKIFKKFKKKKENNECEENNKYKKSRKNNKYESKEEDPKRWIKSERNKEKKRNTEVKTLRKIFKKFKKKKENNECEENNKYKKSRKNNKYESKEGKNNKDNKNEEDKNKEYYNKIII